MPLTCRRCRRPITNAASHADVFEGMHYVCFHYEFEHRSADVDASCGLHGCPSNSLGDGRDAVVATARQLALEAASGAPWENGDLHSYLEAFAAWLADSDGYYGNLYEATPRNGWEVVNDALRAATIYE